VTSPQRGLLPDDRQNRRPVHAVWELTLACDLRCVHCGSRAGKKRNNELSTAECLEVVERLAQMGTREVSLIGGEAYLRPDWTTIAAAIVQAGMECTLQSGARNLTDTRLREAAAAGVRAIGISIDGLRDVHDRLRGVPGSFHAAVDALGRLATYGIAGSVNTQINKLSMDQLDDLFELFVALRVKNWQVQLTVPMGRASEHPELLLQPYHVLELMPRLNALFERGLAAGLLLQPGNNIGYFGPFEGALRGAGEETLHWDGCLAGDNVIGIEADGTVKGCPSLPTAEYAGGNVRDLPLDAIWNESAVLRSSGNRTRDDLWGFCHGCYYATVCHGGCTWTAHSLLGRAGNNPFCHHRALELQRQGVRERIVQAEAAPGLPFDHGRFDVITETMDGQRMCEPVADETPLKRAGETADLCVCRNCRRHVFAGTADCPFCGVSMAESSRRYAQNLGAAREAAMRLNAALATLVSD
jgi:radical SAM protein with 4Fe4S-binding SPASM domain